MTYNKMQSTSEYRGEAHLPPQVRIKVHKRTKLSYLRIRYLRWPQMYHTSTYNAVHTTQTNIDNTPTQKYNSTDLLMYELVTNVTHLPCYPGYYPGRAGTLNLHRSASPLQYWYLWWLYYHVSRSYHLPS